MDYLSPKGVGKAEISEKRSRFLGYSAPVSSEADAKAVIERIRAEHRDARHNVWCYILRADELFRYSDDGEPQGTAGRPVYELLSREGVTNIVCVVTRYFGGVLLGPGGLSRAYTAAAKAALSAAGVTAFTRKTRVETEIAYSLGDTVKALAKSAGAVIEDIVYSENVTIFLLLPPGEVRGFIGRVTEITGGTARIALRGDVFI